ncbi:cupin domain-containing protein [Flavobacterium chungangense]|uniref:Cupin 2 conserved barrel domain-containing protein n=1 Tax=Flavobacterium chungangense TaxID=554283 RepID=A0A6V6YQC0_9FLAO|nr:hypothetical protein [Flavobacterium chungangense]CAD0001576.1 hypothetical protein FLACHUCJ7_00564 [Flavobacterium chungangense]
MIQITRVYSDKNGESHFEDFEVLLRNNGDIGFLSDDEPVKSIVFREVSPSYDYDFHNAPDRQYIVLLDGGVEIETSLGEKRIFETGSVLLMEDTAGKGHKTKNIEPRIRKSIFIKL